MDNDQVSPGLDAELVLAMAGVTADAGGIAAAGDDAVAGAGKSGVGASGVAVSRKGTDVVMEGGGVSLKEVTEVSLAVGAVTEVSRAATGKLAADDDIGPPVMFEPASRTVVAGLVEDRVGTVPSLGLEDPSFRMGRGREPAVFLVDILTTILRPGSGQWSDLDLDYPILPIINLRTFFNGLGKKQVTIIGWVDVDLLLGQTAASDEETMAKRSRTINHIYWATRLFCAGIAIVSVKVDKIETIITSLGCKTTIVTNRPRRFSNLPRINTVSHQLTLKYQLGKYYDATFFTLAYIDVVFVITNKYCTKLGVLDKKQARLLSEVASQTWYASEDLVLPERRKECAKVAQHLDLTFIFLRVLDGGGLSHGDGTKYVHDPDSIYRVVVI